MYPNAHSIFHEAARTEALQSAARGLEGRTIVQARVWEDHMILTLDNGTIFTYAPWADYAEDSGVAVYINGKELSQRAEFIGPARPPLTEEEWQAYLDTLTGFQRYLAIEQKRMFADMRKSMTILTFTGDADELPEPPE